MSAFLFFLFLFILIPHCYYVFYEATIMTSTITEKERERRAWTGQSRRSGFPSPGLITVMALMEGPFISYVKRHSEELDVLLIFPEISKVVIAKYAGDRRRTERESQRKSMGDIVDGSSRIMLPG
jgi:hypothetical protein